MAASEAIYQDLLTGLLTGRYRAGSRLREEALATALGTSRTPVRQALQRMHAEGLVELQPNRGALVTECSSRELDQIYELRAMLEGYACREAAPRVEEVQLDRLARLCDQLEQELHGDQETDFSTISQLNLDYHRLLHESSGNRYLVALLGGIIRVPLVIHSFRHYTPDELTRSFAHHREIVAALRAKDGRWAEAVMHAHVSAAHASLRRARDAEPGDVVVDGPGDPAVAPSEFGGAWR